MQTVPRNALELPPVPELPESDEMSDQPKPSIEPEPPTVPHTPVHLAPVTSEVFRAPPGPETFQQQRLRLDRQQTLSFGPQRARHHDQPSPYEKPPGEAVEMAFDVQDLDQTQLPSGWTFNKSLTTWS